MHDSGKILTEILAKTAPELEYQARDGKISPYFHSALHLIIKNVATLFLNDLIWYVRDLISTFLS